MRELGVGTLKEIKLQEEYTVALVANIWRITCIIKLKTLLSGFIIVQSRSYGRSLGRWACARKS